MSHLLEGTKLPIIWFTDVHTSQSRKKNPPKMTLVQRQYSALKERYRCVLLKGKNLLCVRVPTVYLLTPDF